jgi:hypothetical protein
MKILRLRPIDFGNFFSWATFDKTNSQHRGTRNTTVLIGRPQKAHIFHQSILSIGENTVK